MAGLQPSALDSYRRSWHKWLYAIFVVWFVVLAYLGVQPPSPMGERVSQVGTLFYFWLLPADALVEPLGYAQARALSA